LLTLLAAGLASSVIADGVPCGFFAQPDSVITTDVAKVAARSVVNGDTVARARIFAHYSRTASNKMAGASVDTLLADDSLPPFEVLWDCSSVPDQDNYNLWFSAELFDRHGRRLGDSCSTRHAVALDREPAYSTRSYAVPRARGPIVIDARLAEWSHATWEHFVNADNDVWFAAQWDEQALYAAVRVRDSVVFGELDSTSSATPARLPVYLQDGVEMFFDWAYDRSAVRQNDDYQIMIAANGRSQLNARPHADSPAYRAVLATARDSAGYHMEVAFPWGLCPSRPIAGMHIGFNLVNSDREALGGVVATQSWAGITDLRHHNPSEWGTLVLRGRTPWWPWLLAAGLALAALGGALSRRRLAVATAPAPAQLSSVLRDVLAFLEQNHANDQLDSAAVAKSVNLSGPYLGRLIKRETKGNFREFLNRFRVEKAKPLLTGTSLTVSEIAYKTGYTSPSLFSQAFQRYAGCAPSQYRKGKKQ
jgi:AraC-like DNA-binding protein